MSTAAKRCTTLRRHVVRSDVRRSTVASYNEVLTATPLSGTTARFAAVRCRGRSRAAIPCRASAPRGGRSTPGGGHGALLPGGGGGPGPAGGAPEPIPHSRPRTTGAGSGTTRGSRPTARPIARTSPRLVVTLGGEIGRAHL